MPNHLFLPALKKESNSVQPPNESGVWKRTDDGIYGAIAKAISIDADSAQRGASSIPDVWARPIGFRTALKNRLGDGAMAGGSREAATEVVLPRAVSEWRGMLSLLALHEIHGWKVDLVSVDITQTLESDGAAQLRFANPLTTALRTLIPDEKGIELEKGVQYEWTNFVLIRCMGVPVGGFSPTTLVFSAADYAHRMLATDVKVVDKDGFLAPPTGGTDLEYVATWVQQLQTRLNRGADGDKATTGRLNDKGDAKDHTNLINGLLSEWLEALRKGLGHPHDWRFDSKDVEVCPPDESISRGLPVLDKYTVFAQLCRPLKYRENELRSRSDISLAYSRNQTEHKHILVIAPQLLRPQTRIWDAKRLEHVGGDASIAMQAHFSAPFGFTIDKQDLSDRKGMWIRPDLFFLTEELMSAEGGRAFLSKQFQEANSLDDTCSKYVLPFRREILSFFSPREIRENLRPRFKSVDGAVVFSFQLPIRDMNGEFVQIERAYKHKDARQSEGRVVVGNVPTIDLFPQPIDEFWRRYYVIHDGAQELLVNPVLSPLLAAATTESERLYTVQDSRESTRVVAISRDAAYPEALELAKVGKAQNPSGLILTPAARYTPRRDGRWKVGVDFGTSNTNVFRWDEREAGAIRMSFRFSEHLSRVSLGDDSRRARLLREYLVPDANVELPIASALRLHPPTNRKSFRDGIADPLLDSFVHFPASTEFVLPANVRTNLKWEQKETQDVLSFLESLLFLILLEVSSQNISEVDFLFSFPKAYTKDELDAFKSNWSKVIARQLVGEHRVMSHFASRAQDTGSSKVVFGTSRYGKEGIAAGCYFSDERTVDKKMKAKIAQVAMVLDVGGATTDISLWAGRKISLDASLRLAGRDIAALLQKGVTKRCEQLTELLFEQRAAVALADKRNEPEAFASRLNLILKEQGAIVEQRLLDNFKRTEIQWLRQMIAIEFAAIAYYGGALIAAANTATNGLVLRNLEEYGITLHWGGNAAKFINWIDLGKFKLDGVASDMLNPLLLCGILDAGMKVNQDEVWQLQSVGHKSEAAGGLIVTPEPMLEDEDMADTEASASLPRTRKKFSYTAEEGTSSASAEESLPTESLVTLGEGVLCGEDIELADGTVVGYLQFVDEKMLFDAEETRFKKTTLRKLTRFVSMVNKFGIECGLFNESTKIDLSKHALAISSEVYNLHLSQATEKFGKRVIEPVFITEVRLLLNHLRTDGR